MLRKFKAGIVLFLILVTIKANSLLSALNPKCILCHSIVQHYQKSIPRKPTQLILEKMATQYCTQLKIQTLNVCKGVIDQMTDTIVDSLWWHYSNPQFVCPLLDYCPQEYFVRDINQEIKLILKDKPQKEWEKPTGKKVIKALHVTDMHPDPFYTVGSPGKCNEPLCCRATQYMNANPWQILGGNTPQHLQVNDTNADSPAGYWGSLNSCDLPIQTLDLFFKELTQINPDFIIWTGDSAPHDIWNQSQAYNLNFTLMLTERFINVTKAKVVPAMGNHESYPVNIYDYKGTRQKKLNEELSKAWKPWLTDQAVEMLRTKGFFSYTLPEFNNLKIISVNTQAQNNLNFINLRNPTDPGHMLQWIESELKEAEKAGQFVYIVGHIPPRQSLNDWAMRFDAVTERYSYIIRGQFYGHTHDDEIGLIPSFLDKQKLAAYYLVAPSLTTFERRHPEYRVLTIDYDTLQVLDYEQYRLDLNKFTKKEDPAQFQLLYSFRETYNLKDMTIAEGMSKFRSRLQQEQQIQMKYSRLKKSGVDEGHAGQDVYCSTMASPQLQSECKGSKYRGGIFQMFAGSWHDVKSSTLF